MAPWQRGFCPEMGAFLYGLPQDMGFSMGSLWVSPIFMEKNLGNCEVFGIFRGFGFGPHLFCSFRTSAVNTREIIIGDVLRDELDK